MTVTEAAKQLEVSPRTIRRWCNTGKLTGERVEGKYGDEWRVLLEPGQPGQPGQSPDTSESAPSDQSESETSPGSTPSPDSPDSPDMAEPSKESEVVSGVVSEVSEPIPTGDPLLRSMVIWNWMSEVVSGLSELQQTVKDQQDQLQAEQESSRQREETLLEILQANHEAEERRATEQTAQIEALRTELAELKRPPWWAWWRKKR